MPDAQYDDFITGCSPSGASMRRCSDDIVSIAMRCALLAIVVASWAVYSSATPSGCVGDCKKVSIFETIVPREALPPVKIPITTCGKNIKIQRGLGENEFLPAESELAACPERVAFTKAMEKRIKDLQFPQKCPPANEARQTPSHHARVDPRRLCGGCNAPLLWCVCVFYCLWSFVRCLPMKRTWLGWARQ